MEKLLMIYLRIFFITMVLLPSQSISSTCDSKLNRKLPGHAPRITQTQIKGKKVPDHKDYWDGDIVSFEDTIPKEKLESFRTKEFRKALKYIRKNTSVERDKILKQRLVSTQEKKLIKSHPEIIQAAEIDKRMVAFPTHKYYESEFDVFVKKYRLDKYLKERLRTYLGLGKNPLIDNRSNKMVTVFRGIFIDDLRKLDLNYKLKHGVPPGKYHDLDYVSTGAYETTLYAGPLGGAVEPSSVKRSKGLLVVYRIPANLLDYDEGLYHTFEPTYYINFKKMKKAGLASLEPFVLAVGRIRSYEGYSEDILKSVYSSWMSAASEESQLFSFTHLFDWLKDDELKSLFK